MRGHTGLDPPPPLVIGIWHDNVICESVLSDIQRQASPAPHQRQAKQTHRQTLTSEAEHLC
jgi:hypothetical protein